MPHPFSISARKSPVVANRAVGIGFSSNPTNRQFYVYYTDPTGNLTVARYLRHITNRDLADPLSGVVLTSVPHPGASKHNGGMLAFGPDNCLYAGTGDGGTGGAPAQDTSSLLGKILRLNPDAPGPSASCTNAGQNPFGNQVWSYGLRNPWRFSFDRGSNDLYIADVGEHARGGQCRHWCSSWIGRQLWMEHHGGRSVWQQVATAGLLTPPVLDYPHGNGAFAAALL
jgi:hypothetical protein